MDDIGIGEHFAKMLLASLNLFLIISALFLMYFKDKRAYILLISVLLNIASGRYFGSIHEVMTWDNAMNYVLWKAANVVLLIWIFIRYFIDKEKTRKNIRSEKSKIKLRNGLIIFFICFCSIWLILIIFFALRAIFIMQGHL